MTPRDTHLLLTVPLVLFVVGGVWLWGWWDRLWGAEELFSDRWPCDVQADADEPAKPKIGERFCDSP